MDRALEDTLIRRFRWTHGGPKDLTLRHDNGLVFGPRAYLALVKDYALKQEYITPYTSEQNGLWERFIRSFKKECAWLHRFQDIREARVVVALHRPLRHPEAPPGPGLPDSLTGVSRPPTPCLIILKLVQQSGEDYTSLTPWLGFKCLSRPEF